ncbi:MAG: alpha-amylase family protein [Rhodospirillales bacterium]|nr:alpha-amylase family protein [Rhodospirillales bacterium]
MWYKNAIIYSLDVETFQDSDGDGIGDFHGLVSRIDYLDSLGVDAVWLQPFQPTPNRDDGYDIIDFYGVDARLGTLGDFVEFARALEDRGIRLILDLVVNHTSDQHPWFQEACADPSSKYRDYYLWSKEKPAGADTGMVFPGVQETTWTWNEQAGAYYFHRFYHHQPDLNIDNPMVREEILRIIGFWLKLGVSGFRVDAAPFLIELLDDQAPQHDAMFAFLETMNATLSWQRGDAILLAEANVGVEKIDDYFGDGRRMHMMFNFIVNQALFLALARERSEPLRRALESLPPMHEKSQWAQFLRGHDELDLGRLADDERQEVFQAFGPEPGMQIYHRGIRRRLAPMLDGDRARIEMAHSLMFSLPGTQVIRYGDEIGMGEDLSLNERNALRTPMQWADTANAGFSSASPDRLIRPVVDEGAFGYRTVNVEAQLADADSLLNRMQRLIRARTWTREIGVGAFNNVETDRPNVMAHVCRSGNRLFFAIHNLAAEPCTVRPALAREDWKSLREVVADRQYPAANGELEVGGYGYRWFRADRAG